MKGKVWRGKKKKLISLLSSVDALWLVGLSEGGGGSDGGAGGRGGGGNTCLKGGRALW